MGKSIMWQYIDEEPAILKALMEAKEIDALAKEIGNDLQAVYFVAHGSSFNASVAVSDFLARTANLRVYACTPANFYCNLSSVTREPKKGTVVVTISQTGTSSGAIEALEYADSLGFSTIGITAVMDSPVAKKSTWTLPLMCGEEDSNAKTKGYSATLTVLMRFALALGEARGTVDAEKADAIRNELWSMIAAIPETKEKVLAWCEANSFGESLKDLYVLGSGMNFGTAQEGQLKLMETMCIPTMFNDLGEFSHGMHRSIIPESSLLIFRSGDRFDSLAAEAFRYLQGITPHVLMVDVTGKAAEDKNCIALQALPNTQGLLLTTLVVQVLSVYAPEKIGLDPNRDAHNDFTEVVGTRVSC